MMKIIHVAVAVIIRNEQILIALRKPEQHQGGLWEFPGGKVETNESGIEALRREVYEELNLSVLSAVPMLELSHEYDDRTVNLSVWLVTSFSGEAQGNEGQTIRWIAISDIEQYAFPTANTPIVQAIQQHLTQQA
ncbi:hypothetical protein LCGC14_0907820 [marine sediment metagenome]|uniref:8-oxo-dGTP diphosphatase n=1 Tax=marine sediment metagenome TaxID=412755 RepID=A0A0F9S1C1_9ZZZZ